MGILKFCFIIIISANISFAQSDNDFEREKTNSLNIPLIPLTNEKGVSIDNSRNSAEATQILEPNDLLCPTRPKEFWEGAPIKQIVCKKQFILPTENKKIPIPDNIEYPQPNPTSSVISGEYNN